MKRLRFSAACQTGGTDVSCTELDALIEPIAAGEIEPDAGVRAHLATCLACSRALALARQVDAVLAAQPPPDPSPAFTPTLMARLRRERWRSEQYLDLAFNVAVALAIVAGVGGLWLVLSATGLVGVSTDVTRLFVARYRVGVRLHCASLARLYAGDRSARERDRDLVVG